MNFKNSVLYFTSPTIKNKKKWQECFRERHKTKN